jgi:hypothetical protein
MGMVAFDSDGGGGGSSWWSVIYPESYCGCYKSAVIDSDRGGDRWGGGAV